MGSAWPTGAYATSTSPSVFDLLPQLSADEKARFPSLGRAPERQAVTTFSPPKPIGPPIGIGYTSEACRMRIVHDALHHYNAGHPGAEFDAVKSLKEDRVHFKGKPWFHINFLARSRSSKNIKTFFAEVHYEPPTDGKPFSRLPVVEACIILDESSSQYRSSCAFCRSYLDVLHPVDDHDFVCGTGNDKDWMIEELFGMRFISCGDLASNSEMEEEKRDLASSNSILEEKTEA